jgi:uncharacterized repeat protein (TIGR01451 family)
MKKYFLLLFIFCLQLAPSKAQWVTIPDANFANTLQQFIPSCMNGNQMDTICAQNVIFLDPFSSILNCSSQNILDLTGIEYLYGLLVLNCEYNQLTTLPRLPSTLINLDCHDNQLTSFYSIPGSLLGLDCWNNQLTSLPPVPSVMNYFHVENNNISCLANLPNVNDITDGNILANPLSCVPNQTNYSLGLPLCLYNDPISNPNNCPSSNLTGNIFTDLNNNCIYETTDLNTDNLSVQLFDNQNNLLQSTYTLNGSFSFSGLSQNSYFIKLNNTIVPVTIDCGQSNILSATLSSSNQTIASLDFPVQCSEQYDLYTQSVSTSGWIFPGETHTLKANILSNEAWFNLDCGASNFSGNVSINVTGPVTFISPANNALIPTVNGNTFTYNIADFSTLTPQSFGLKFQTDTTAQANDQICVHVEINPTPFDLDTTNNVYDFCYNVVNSYDPNMKEVYPVNVLPGYDDWFTYTIHFQNTGNAPAFNIRLRDTLDANLDINTFEIRGYSHPAVVSINGNNLTVRFNNIMLPDSTTDYEGSMGYFQYRIKPLPNLPLGTQIENTAYIYFDYNAPIITNTTQNNFQTVVSTINKNEIANQLKVFPNPANELLNINLQNSVIENCIISNALGQTVFSSANEINSNHKIQLNISHLSAGVYFVKVRAGDGSYNAKFIKSE